MIFTKIDGIDTLLCFELANGICVVFLGMFLMLSRKKAVSQVLGLMLIENGMYAAALFGVGGMPLTVEIGTFFDLFFELSFIFIALNFSLRLVGILSTGILTMYCSVLGIKAVSPGLRDENLTRGGLTSWCVDRFGCGVLIYSSS